MTKATLVGLASVLVAGSVLAPAQAFADGRHHRHGGHRHHDRLRTELPKRVFPHRFFHGHGRFGVIAPPIVSYAVPVYVPPVSTAPPVYYPPAYVPAPPAYSYTPPPMQTVIEFPTGRYELRGDGITTPYRWVWIPNPPTAPPPDAAPAPPDAAPDTPPTAAPAAREPARILEFYRWTDNEGVVHLTDRWDKVPEAYRSKAKKSES